MQLCHTVPNLCHDHAHDPCRDRANVTNSNRICRHLLTDQHLGPSQTRHGAHWRTLYRLACFRWSLTNCLHWRSLAWRAVCTSWTSRTCLKGERDRKWGQVWTQIIVQQPSAYPLQLRRHSRDAASGGLQEFSWSCRSCCCVRWRSAACEASGAWGLC